MKREEPWLREQERVREPMRPRHAPRPTETALPAALEERAEDWSWNPQFALDLQDFPHLFLHHEQFNKQTHEWLDIAYAKITDIHNDGEDGYFNKFEKNIGWTQHITPIIFSDPSITDQLVRCLSTTKSSGVATRLMFVVCPFGTICSKPSYTRLAGTPARFRELRGWFHHLGRDDQSSERQMPL